MIFEEKVEKEFSVFINELRNNYLFYVSRLIDRALIAPDMIQIMLTSRCNLRCKMCGVWKTQYETKDELSTAEVKSLIDQAIELGVKTVYFTGGEALLREDLFELIDYAARENIITTFNTNGSLITREIAERIAKSKLRSLAFSIDSPEEAVHDQLRGKGVFRSAMQAVEWINRYKKDTGRPDLVMCSVVMKQNVHDLDKLAHIAENNGFCYLAFQPVVDNSGLWQQVEDSQDVFWVDKDSLPVLRETLRRVDDFKQANCRPAIDVMSDKLIGYFSKEKRLNTCFAGFSRIFVNPLGDISFVCFESFGNIKRDKLKDAWYGINANQLRKKIKKCELNCTQFCSEKPESESLFDIHRNFLTRISEKFQGEFCAELLEKEKTMLRELLSCDASNSRLAVELSEVAAEVDNTLKSMPKGTVVKCLLGRFWVMFHARLSTMWCEIISRSFRKSGIMQQSPKKFTEDDLFTIGCSSAVSSLNREFTQFYLAITNRCNLKCIMCSTTRHPHEQEQELTLDEWMALLANITRFKTQVITFGGGEPLLRKNDLVKMISFVASRKITVNVVTNGTLMNEEFLNAISDYKERVVFLVSCDGLRKENDFIRGEGTFDKIISAAGLIKKHGFKLIITSVIMPENFSGFVDFLKFINRCLPEIDLDIQPVIPHNEVYHRRKSFELDEGQVSQLRGVLDFLHKENSVKLCRPLQIIDRYMDYFLGQLITHNQCKMGTDSFNVNLRGNIWICGKELEFPLHKYKLESILSSDGYLKEMKRVQSCQSPCLAGLVI